MFQIHSGKISCVLLFFCRLTKKTMYSAIKASASIFWRVAVCVFDFFNSNCWKKKLIESICYLVAWSLKKHWDVNREAHLCSTTWTHSPVVKATQMLSNDLGFCDIKCTEMWKYKQLEETCKSTPCGDAAWGFRLAKKHPLRFRTRNLQITHKWMMCFHHWL